MTVVDSTSFLHEIRKADELQERGLEAEEWDTRTVADLLVSQVSTFCSMLLASNSLCTSTGRLCLPRSASLYLLTASVLLRRFSAKFIDFGRLSSE